MATQSITPKRLLRDSLISVIPIYSSLLVFRIPRLIFSLLQFLIPEILYSTVIELLYLFSIGIIFYGAILVFTYKKLNQEEVTISQSLKKATEKFLELIIIVIISFFLLITSPFYAYSHTCFPRLYFASFLVMNNGYTPADAFKRSWQLTKGYGWQIFWNILSIVLIWWVLSFLPSLISASIFGVSVWDINRRELSTTHAAFIWDRLLTITISSLIYIPFHIVYVTLMFIRLLALEKRNSGSVTM